jgi:hypothetical protein
MKSSLKYIYIYFKEFLFVAKLVTTHRKLGFFFSSDFSSRLSGEDAQKDLTINGDSLSGMVELFLKPC